MAYVGYSFNSFSVFLLSLKRQRNLMKMMFSCIHFPIWPYPPKIMKKLYFILVNCMGWQVCCTHAAVACCCVVLNVPHCPCMRGKCHHHTTPIYAWRKCIYMYMYNMCQFLYNHSLLPCDSRPVRLWARLWKTRAWPILIAWTRLTGYSVLERYLGLEHSL